MSYVDIHAYLLAIAGSLWLLTMSTAGYVSPWFDKSWYVHDRHVGLIFVCCLLSSALICCTVYFSYAYNARSFTEFFEFIWHVCNYWSWAPEYAPDVFTFSIMYGFAAADVIVPFLVVLLTRNMWTKKNLKSTSNTKRIIVSPHRNEPVKNVPMAEQLVHGFLVVAHNSSSDIDQCIRPILAHVEPWQLFIADNGSSLKERELTRKVCDKILDEYCEVHPNYFGDPIQLIHLDKGNKTWAQYAVVKRLAENRRAAILSGDTDLCNTAVNTVTMLDDDVFWSSEWNVSSIEREFADRSTVAIAYPLYAENGSSTIWTRLQECEYVLGDADRFLQDRMGTNLFASGAAATWRIEVLYNVLQRHDTAFNGEDLAMGYISMKLSGRKEKLLFGSSHLDPNVLKSAVVSPQVSTDTSTTDISLVDRIEDITVESRKAMDGVRIALCKDVFIPTIVPFCYAHWQDYLPNIDCIKKLGWKCRCGEASIFGQRLRSWDAANHSFFIRYLKIVFSKGGLKSRSKWFARVMAFWKFIGVIREYAYVLAIIYTMIRSKGEITFLLSLSADMIFVWSGLYNTAQSIVNFGLLRQSGMAVRYETLVMFPILFLLPYMVFIRPIVAIYNVFYYSFIRFPPEIRNVLKKDEALAKQIEECWTV